MTTRRTFIALLGGAAAAWPLTALGPGGAPLTANAQQPGTPVVGFLCLSSPEAFRPRLAAFRQGLLEAGFVEDRNVDIEYRWANDDASRLPELAAELVRQKVQVIATAGGPAPALAAKEATSRIPIVFATPGSRSNRGGAGHQLKSTGREYNGCWIFIECCVWKADRIST